jgi:hypothetical protein
MATQPNHPPYAQNKGTLISGQIIPVNKHTVQVERYLSQGLHYPFCGVLRWRPFFDRFSGGFAHVYLVRTATPVNNATQHVLKRIAVASESLLSEVEKEIDFMVYLLSISFRRSIVSHHLNRGYYKGTQTLCVLLMPQATGCQQARMRCSFLWNTVLVGHEVLRCCFAYDCPDRWWYNRHDEPSSP